MDAERWANRFGNQVAEVFYKLGELYPPCADGFRALLEKALEGVDKMRHESDEYDSRLGIGEKPREAEAHPAAGDYAERVASLIQSIGRIAALDFPELGERFGAIADQVGEVVTEYRRKLTGLGSAPVLVTVGGVTQYPSVNTPEPEPVRYPTREDV